MVVGGFEGKGMPYVTDGILQTYVGNPELLGPFYCSFTVDILAGNCQKCCENVCNVEFYDLTYVRNGQIKVFYGSVLLNCCEYVQNAEFDNLSYGSDGQIKTTHLGSLQRNYTFRELK